MHTYWVVRLAICIAITWKDEWKLWKDEPYSFNLSHLCCSCEQMENEIRREGREWSTREIHIVESRCS